MDHYHHLNQDQSCVTLHVDGLAVGIFPVSHLLLPIPGPAPTLAGSFLTAHRLSRGPSVRALGIISFPLPYHIQSLISLGHQLPSC